LSAKTRESLARVFIDLDRPLRAVEVMRRAIGDAIMAGDPEVLAETYLALADLMARTGDYATAVQELTEGVDLVTAGAGPESHSGPKLLWKIVARVAQLYLESATNLESLKPALRWAHAALTHAERVDTQVGRATAHLLLAEILQKAGQNETASTHFTEALSVLRSLGDRKGQAECLLRTASGTNHGKSNDTLEAYELASEIGWSEGMELAEAAAIHGDSVA
jgi:tetratricopeptide (TPR) repeat protein